MRVNTKTSPDKIKANQMDFIKTKCKQREVNRITNYNTKLWLIAWYYILQYDLLLFVYTLF